MTGTIQLLSELDQVYLHPRLRGLPMDRRLVLEITFSSLEHILGGALALFVCSRIFRFAIKGTTAWFFVWMALAGFVVVHATGYALLFHRKLKEKEVQEERLRALAAQAELRALKAQINPHFLFNTLNTIAQLIHTDPPQAEATVERLAEMLRYAMAGGEQAQGPLREELAFVDAYLEIERARFGQRLHLTRQVTPEVLDVPVPSLILQPLVENAVRHGRGSDGTIDLIIDVQSQAGDVVITIADRGPGMPPNHEMGEGRGVGLHNVDERLRKTYGPEYGLEIRDNEPRGTAVILRIPAGA